MKHSHKILRGIPRTLLACAAVMTTTLATPTPAKADPSLTAVALISGAVVVGSIFAAHQESFPPQASSTFPGARPPYVTGPYPAPAMAMMPSPNVAVIYSSVAPYAPPVHAQAMMAAQPAPRQPPGGPQASQSSDNQKF